jgi:hypothetical protein
MIVYVRFGTLVRCVLCTVVITIALAAALIHPGEPDQTSPTTSPTTARPAG